MDPRSLTGLEEAASLWRDLVGVALFIDGVQMSLGLAPAPAPPVVRADWLRAYA